ncbi:MAG: FlgD immunoglobulin-like domain containing protein [Rubricoccaceae bacterium]|nr:FlgD immunoglobulin-like domain containing protein [Rubricoccaceae bacterium]
MRLLLLAFAALAICAQAQPVEAPGPFAVGHLDVAFADETSGPGWVEGRLYYPALRGGLSAPPNPSGGPFPLVGFQHGYRGSAHNYDSLSTHLASWGFVVASTDTEGGPSPDPEQFARDTRSLLHYVEGRSSTPGDPLAGMVDNGPWAAAGHSMGGAVLALLAGIEPRVRVLVGLQSAFAGDGRFDGALDALRTFTGTHVQIAGTDDALAPPAGVIRYVHAAEAAARNVYFEVEGLGHFGCIDGPIGGTLPAEEQQRLHRRLVTGVLRAEVRGEENLYAELLGEGIADEPITFEARCPTPLLWARPSATTPDALVVGTAGTPGARTTLAWSPTPATAPSPFGLPGIDFDPERVLFDGQTDARGAVEVIVPYRALDAEPKVYVQALHQAPKAGGLTRVAVQRIGVVSGTPEGPTAPGGLSLDSHPSPFTAATTVSFEMPGAGPVTLVAYDLLGRPVHTLANGSFEAGRHTLHWDGRDAAGRTVGAGRYVLRLQTGAGAGTRVVLKTD